MSTVFPESPLGSPVTMTAGGYRGPAAHTFTRGCAGFHPPSEPCPAPAAATPRTWDEVAAQPGVTTEMPIEHAAHAAVAPQPPRGDADRLREALPVLALITTRPQLLDAVARAVRAGVPDAEAEGLIAGLHGLASKAEGLARQGSGPQPAPFPQGTGPFTPARALGIGELFTPAADHDDHDHDRSM